MRQEEKGSIPFTRSNISVSTIARSSTMSQPTAIFPSDVFTLRTARVKKAKAIGFTQIHSAFLLRL
jgi:hypothetical protein